MREPLFRGEAKWEHETQGGAGSRAPPGKVEKVLGSPGLGRWERVSRACGQIALEMPSSWEQLVPSVR